MSNDRSYWTKVILTGLVVAVTGPLLYAYVSPVFFKVLPSQSHQSSEAQRRITTDSVTNTNRIAGALATPQETAKPSSSTSQTTSSPVVSEPDKQPATSPPSSDSSKQTASQSPDAVAVPQATDVPSDTLTTSNTRDSGVLHPSLEGTTQLSIAIPPTFAQKTEAEIEVVALSKQGTRVYPRWSIEPTEGAAITSEGVLTLDRLGTYALHAELQGIAGQEAIRVTESGLGRGQLGELDVEHANPLEIRMYSGRASEPNMITYRWEPVAGATQYIIVLWSKSPDRFFKVFECGTETQCAVSTEEMTADTYVGQIGALVDGAFRFGGSLIILRSSDGYFDF